MKANSAITINGRLYDAVTGLPVQADTDTPAAKIEAPHAHQEPNHHAAPANAHQVHQQPQKSTTLHRAALKRPKPMAADIVPAKQQAVHHRSPVITKFAPHIPQATQHQQSQQAVQATPVVAVPSQPTTPEAPNRPHPVVERALAKHYAPMHSAQSGPTPAHEPQQHEAMVRASSNLKEHLIAQSLAAAQPNTEAPHPKKGLFARKPRLASVLMVSLAILVLGGYLTYLNLPNISMRVAATRAGVAATFPGYRPDGYQFSGPITYAPGEVAVAFKSTGGNSVYSVTQKASTWDSQAVLQNYVLKQSHIYLTYQEHGLTIYSFGNSAAWVNGGVLYTIDGNAPLSSDQLLNIAGSL